MKKDWKEIYYTLLDRMVDAMTNPEVFDRDSFVEILKQICELFHLAKGVTEFYPDLASEKSGQGEVMIDYDNGRGEVEILKRRFVTDSMAVIRGTLYMAKEDAPLSEEQLEKVDILLRALLSFVVRNRLQKTVEKFGYHDEEGYPNMRYFGRFLGQKLMNGALENHTAICFNLRHFSLVNQEIGREKADKVMKAYVELLERTAGEGNILCRMGGDNFVMTTDTGNLPNILQIFSGYSVRYGEDSHETVPVSASAGIFVIPKGYAPGHVGEIIDHIYSPLQLAKMGGEDTIVFYDRDMVTLREHTLQVQQQFPGALANKEFHVFFQPKVDVKTGRIHGAEALCRWIRNGKIVPPMDFIPVLEQTTDICLLDFYMLDQVCQHMRKWLDEGRESIRVSVNLSRKHLSDMDLLDHILEIIDKYKVPHESIEIELTETTTDVGFRDLTRVVNGLHAEGVCTSVDDFGIGYSSLNLIREIPWDVLKIDRSFLPTDEDAETSVTYVMFRHVVSMAKDLGLECITEGVETGRQVKILRENGCQFAQGYYFDKPLPVEEFEEKIDTDYYKKKARAAKK